MKHGKIVSIMEPVKGGSLANIMDDAKKLFKSILIITFSLIQTPFRN